MQVVQELRILLRRRRVNRANAGPRHGETAWAGLLSARGSPWGDVNRAAFADCGSAALGGMREVLGCNRRLLRLVGHHLVGAMMAGMPHMMAPHFGIGVERTLARLHLSRLGRRRLRRLVG